MLRQTRDYSVELWNLLAWWREHVPCDGPGLTISTFVVAEASSSQQPQFIGKRCTLRKNQDIASSVFFSLAKTIP